MPSRSCVNKEYVVRLTDAERAKLDAMIRTGKRAAQMLMKARVVLAADVLGPGLSDGLILEMRGTSRSTVERVRHRQRSTRLNSPMHFAPTRGAAVSYF